jgi:20S proteasome subunit alpha 7
MASSLMREYGSEPLTLTPRSIHLVHDDNQDKAFELEMTWVCEESGMKHAAVPADLLAEAEEKAKAALEEGMEED